MITITPFRALRPESQYASRVASRPYDALDSAEARIEAEGNPYSFLRVTKSEIDLPPNADVYSPQVYEKAKENLASFMARKVLFREEKACYYVYRLTMDGKSQTGVVCGSSVEDYERDLIKKHEFTRPDKERDRINHIAATRAQTGNVFLAYKNIADMDTLAERLQTENAPAYDILTEDGIRHSVWVVSDDDAIQTITELFRTRVPCTYIADGHHRAASAAKARKELGQAPPAGADIFLTTLFPANQLRIMDYNRVVKDFNGLSKEEFFKSVAEKFDIAEAQVAYSPDAPHKFGMYAGKQWYVLTAKENAYAQDPIGVLDVTILQNNLLDPVLGIKDQRTDKRIDFVGGIRGLGELERRVDGGAMSLAFSLYPVGIAQLFDVADSGNVMPPKSTWFEPKLRDGLLTHLID